MEPNFQIGVLGIDGFVGKNVYYFLQDSFITIGINKKNYNEYKGTSFDYFINCNGNSKKYQAEKDPILDLKNNVESVYHSIFDFDIKNYIHFSSIDSDLNTTYGIHKRFSEDIVKKYFINPYILKCCSIIGKNMKKGILYDILNDIPLRVTKGSRIQFISVNEVCKFVKYLIINTPNQKEYNVTGINNLSVEEIGQITNKELKFEDNLKHEYYGYSGYNKSYPFKTSLEYVKDVINVN
jgi:nucleoside-diphosphate-sugar epimerase